MLLEDVLCFLAGVGVIVFFIYQFKVAIPRKKQREYEEYIENAAIDELLIEKKKEELRNKLK